jgi:uncharacterized delta-60 repeat protein
MRNIYFTLIVVITSIYSYAQPGLLDSAFGANGIATTLMSTGTGCANATAVQSDDKIVLAEYTFNGLQNVFAVARYTAKGILDNSFGTEGRVLTPILTGNAEANAVAIQSDGKIVVVGTYQNMSPYKTDIIIARYNAVGTLDDTFGVNGLIVKDIANYDSHANSVVIQSDGAIVVAGNLEAGTSSNFLLVRYNPNGFIDSSFGTNGVVVSAFGGQSCAYAAVFQNDGKILVSGYSGSQTKQDLSILRFESNGAIDQAFGTNGVTMLHIDSSSYSSGNALALKADGKIIVAGRCLFIQNNGFRDNEFVTAQFNANGKLDTLFGVGGAVIEPIGFSAVASALAIQKNGKIVIAGSAYDSRDFTIVRYDSTGTYDPEFGANGMVNTPVGLNAYASSISLQSDGKIIVSGSVMIYIDYNARSGFAMARYYCDTSKLSQNNRIIVFPNPALDQISVVVADQSEIEIYNISGQLVKTIENAEKETTIDIGDLPKGIYLIKAKILGKNVLNFTTIKETLIDKFVKY